MARELHHRSLRHVLSFRRAPTSGRSPDELQGVDVRGRRDLHLQGRRRTERRALQRGDDRQRGLLRRSGLAALGHRLRVPEREVPNDQRWLRVRPRALGTADELHRRALLPEWRRLSVRRPLLLRRGSAVLQRGHDGVLVRSRTRQVLLDPLRSARTAASTVFREAIVRWTRSPIGIVTLKFQRCISRGW